MEAVFWYKKSRQRQMELIQNSFGCCFSIESSTLFQKQFRYPRLVFLVKSGQFGFQGIIREWQGGFSAELHCNNPREMHSYCFFLFQIKRWRHLTDPEPQEPGLPSVPVWGRGRGQWRGHCGHGDRHPQQGRHHVQGGTEVRRELNFLNLAWISSIRLNLAIKKPNYISSIKLNLAKISSTM